MPLQTRGPWKCWECGREVTGSGDGVFCHDEIAKETIAACNEHAKLFQRTVVSEIVGRNRAAVLRKRRDKEERWKRKAVTE